MVRTRASASRKRNEDAADGDLEANGAVVPTKNGSSVPSVAASASASSNNNKKRKKKKKVNQEKDIKNKVNRFDTGVQRLGKEGVLRYVLGFLGLNDVTRLIDCVGEAKKDGDDDDNSIVDNNDGSDIRKVVLKSLFHVLTEPKFMKVWLKESKFSELLSVLNNDSLPKADLREKIVRAMMQSRYFIESDVKCVEEQLWGRLCSGIGDKDPYLLTLNKNRQAVVGVHAQFPDTGEPIDSPLRLMVGGHGKGRYITDLIPVQALDGTVYLVSSSLCEDGASIKAWDPSGFGSLVWSGDNAPPTTTLFALDRRFPIAQQSIVSGTTDGRLIFWDIMNGSYLGTIVAHTTSSHIEAISCVANSVNHTYVVLSCGSDGFIRAWRLDHKRSPANTIYSDMVMEWSLAPGYVPFSNVCMIPGPKAMMDQFASVSQDMQLTFWKVGIHEPVKSFERKCAPKVLEPGSITTSNGETVHFLVIAGPDCHNLDLINTETHTVLSSMYCQSRITSVCISPNLLQESEGVGKPREMVVTVTADRNLRFWDPEDGSQLFRYTLYSIPVLICPVKVGPNEVAIAAVSTSILLYDITHTDYVPVRQHYCSPFISSLSTTSHLTDNHKEDNGDDDEDDDHDNDSHEKKDDDKPEEPETEGKVSIISGAETWVHVWEDETGRLLKCWESCIAPDRIQCLIPGLMQNANGILKGVLAVGCTDGHVKLWTQKGKQLLDIVVMPKRWILDVCFIEEIPETGTPFICSGSSDGTIHAHSALSGELMWQSMETEMPIDQNPPTTSSLCLKTAPTKSSDMVILGATEFTIKALQPKDGTVLWKIPQTFLVESFAPLVHENWVAFTDTLSRNVIVIDPSTGETKQTWNIASMQSNVLYPVQVCSVVFPDNRELVVVKIGSHGAIQIWDPQTATLVMNATAPQANFLRPLPNGRLAAACTNGCINIFHINLPRRKRTKAHQLKVV